jgi:hypothetical protein
MALFWRKARCPYCKETLEPKPTRNRACPHCSQKIIVDDGKLLTTEAAAIRERLEFLGQYGITAREFASHREKLAEELGRRASVSETAWRVLDLLLDRMAHECDRRIIYAEMAQLARSEGKDPNPYLAKSFRYELQALRQDGYYEGVQIVTSNSGKVCSACRALADRILTLDEALAQMPIPDGCHAEGGCRCMYLPIRLR